MILDGKTLAREIGESLKNKIADSGKSFCLAIVQVGDLPQSNAYIRQKKRVGAEIGIEVRHIVLGADVAFEKVKNTIEELNNDEGVTGIILQLPLPAHLSERSSELMNLIDITKDADGLTSGNADLLLSDNPCTLPATPRGIISILEKDNIQIKNKKAVVIGRSNLVGKPMATILLQKGADVTVVHRQTENPKDIIQQADIVIVAIGSPKYFDASYFCSGQVVIDVGINEFVDATTGTKRLCGDVDFESVSQIVYAITPVPGGVGPMTVISLFENVVDLGLKRVL